VAADFLLRKGGERKFNVKTLRLGPLSKRGVYLAFQTQGASMALLSVRVFFKKCPPLVSALSSFAETVPRTLVQEAQGVCVEHAAQLQGSRPRPPKLFCGEDGQWVGQPTTSCACLPGYETSEGHTVCTGKEEEEGGGGVRTVMENLEKSWNFCYGYFQAWKSPAGKKENPQSVEKVLKIIYAEF